MYRLSKELFDFINEHSKGIGFTDAPQHAFLGGDSEYVLEQDYEAEIPCRDDEGIFYLHKHRPEVEGFWLLKRDELKRGDLPMIVRTTRKDREEEKEVVLEGVLIQSPSAIDKKYEAPYIISFFELVKLEPELKKYIDPSILMNASS